jgi:hypothetical protein
MKMNYIIPALPPALRLSLYGVLIAGGIAYQYLVPDSQWWIGCLILLAGSLVIIAKSYINKPRDLGFEDWQPTSKSEFDRINSNLEFTRKAKYPFYFRKQFGFLLGVMIMVLIVIIFIVSDEPDMQVILALFDCIVILVPIFVSGTINLWTPFDLKLKMERLNAVMKESDKHNGSIVVTPYIRLDKDKSGKKIPEDVRLMIEPKRKNEELVGVQIQVAINNGPNGAVPYMYAVFLCKGKGRLFEILSAKDYGGFAVEPGGDKDYGYIVVRQQTSGGGYHTDNGDCVRLFGTVVSVLGTL